MTSARVGGRQMPLPGKTAVPIWLSANRLRGCGRGQACFCQMPPSLLSLPFSPISFLFFILLLLLFAHLFIYLFILIISYHLYSYFHSPSLSPSLPLSPLRCFFSPTSPSPLAKCRVKVGFDRSRLVLDGFVVGSGE